MTNLASFLVHAAQEHGGRVAVHESEALLTYVELDGASARVATLLRAAGVQPRDRGALVVPNISSFPIAYYGRSWSSAHRAVRESAARHSGGTHIAMTSHPDVDTRLNLDAVRTAQARAGRPDHRHGTSQHTPPGTRRPSEADAREGHGALPGRRRLPGPTRGQPRQGSRFPPSAASAVAYAPAIPPCNHAHVAPRPPDPARWFGNAVSSPPP